MTRIGTLVTKSMTVLNSTDENRFFEGYLTVEMKDKQGEITVVDELYKVLPIWIDRGAPITDTHSNRVIGKGINFAKTTVEDGGVTYPAIKITGKIHKNYELDTDIWEKIKSGEYKGLSFGGATKANRVPKVMKDGDIAYALTDLEHYEVAVCRDPAVPLALITEFNSVAKATVPSEPRGDGKEVIKCNKWGCYVTKSEGEDEPEYHDESNINKEITEKDIEWFKNTEQGETVQHKDRDRPKGKKEYVVGGSKVPAFPNRGYQEGKVETTFSENSSGDKRQWYKNMLEHRESKKGEDWSNADIPTATVTNTVSQSTQTAKPIKTDTKVGVPEKEGGVKLNVTPLEGGIGKNDTPASSGTGGGVRAHIDDASNQDDPVKQTSQVSEKIEVIRKSDINKVIGAILAGAQRVEKRSPYKGTDHRGGPLPNDSQYADAQYNNIQPPKGKQPKGGDWWKYYQEHKDDETTKAGAARIEKKEVWDKKEVGFKERMQKLVHAANTYADEEAKGMGTKQHKDEDRAVSSGKVAPSRTVTISSDAEVQDPKHGVDLDLLHEAKSGYETTDTDIKLGGQAVPTEKEKLTSSLGTQNKEQIATVSKESNYCVSCGQKKTEGMKRDYPETTIPHSDCPKCAQEKKIAERDRKDDAKMEQIAQGIHRNLAASGQKVVRFTGGRKPSRLN